MAQNCGPADIGCHLKNAGADALADGLERIAQQVSEGMQSMLVSATSFWVAMPAPVISDEEGVTGFIKGYLEPWTLTFALCSVLIGAIKMMWDHRNGAGRELFTGLLALSIIASFATTAISVLGVASHQLSTGIIDASIEGGDMGENLAAMMFLSGDVMTPFVVIGLGILGFFAALFQLVLMLIRDAALPILAGCITISAAFWTTETGKAWFRRFIVLTIGFLAYQPAASVIYASAFKRMGGSTISGAANLAESTIATMEFASGIGTLFLAIFMLPALIGFVLPVAGAMAGRGGGGAAVAGAVGGVVAAGAINGGSSQSSTPAPPPVAGTAGSTGGAGPAGAISDGGGGGTASGAMSTAAAGAATGGTGAVAIKAVEAGGQVASSAKNSAEGALGNGDQK